MKLNESQLKQIIKEELQKVLKEYIQIDPNGDSDEVSTLSVMFKPPFKSNTVHLKLFDILVHKLDWYETKESQWNNPDINPLIEDPNNSVFSKNYDYTVGNSSKRFPVVVIITKNSDNNYSVSLFTSKGKKELIKNQNIDDIFNYFEKEFSSKAKQIVDDIYEREGGITRSSGGSSREDPRAGYNTQLRDQEKNKSYNQAWHSARHSMTATGGWREE